MIPSTSCIMCRRMVAQLPRVYEVVGNIAAAVVSRRPRQISHSCLPSDLPPSNVLPSEYEHAPQRRATMDDQTSDHKVSNAPAPT